MSRAVPTAISQAESCPIVLDETSIGYTVAMFDTAVTTMGSGLGRDAAAQGDRFSWRAGGNMWDYSIRCEGMPVAVPGIVGMLAVDRWRLSRTTPGEADPETTYYLDAPTGNLTVMVEGDRHEASFHDVYDFFYAALDLREEIEEWRLGLPNRGINRALNIRPDEDQI